MKINILSTPGNTSMCPTAVLVRNQAILLGLRHYTPEKWKSISVWTTPGGRCDLGETIEETLRREVREEVSIVDLHIHELIGKVQGAKKGDIVPIFFCTTKQDPTLMEPEKFSEWRWVPLSEYVAGGIWAEMNPEVHTVISKYLKDKILIEIKDAPSVTLMKRRVP